MYYVFCMGLFFCMVQTVYSMQETYTFLKTCYEKPVQMGAVFPTSSYAMDVLVQNIVPGQTCLEIGSGTGNVTGHIAKKITELGRVDAVEIDTDLCVLAQEQVGQLPQVHIHNCSILDWVPSYQYDVVVCTLPFNVCSESFVRCVMQHVLPFIKPGGHFVYIEYLWLADMKQIFLMGPSKIDFQNMRAFLASVRSQNKTSFTDIFMNVPPVRVYDMVVK